MTPVVRPTRDARTHRAYERDPTSIVAAFLHVGINRAVSQLVLVGPADLAARVGLG